MSTTLTRTRVDYLPHGSAYAKAVLDDNPLVYFRLNDDTGSTLAVTASSNFSTEPPSNAVDMSATTYWTTNSTTTGWLRIQLSAAAVLKGYKITRRDDIPNRNPKTWTFEGSNDGSAFTVLDTQTNITWPTTGETKSFTFANTTAYLYYRLNVSANSGDATFLSVAEIVLTPAIDSSGNHRDGVFLGTTIFQSTGLLTNDPDHAVTYAGGGRVGVPYGSWANLATIAVEALINPAAIGSILQIWDRDPGSGTRIFQFRINTAGKLEFILWTSGGGPFTITGATTLASGVRRHVGASYDGTTARVLLDGVSDGSSAITGNLIGNTGTGALPMMFGASSQSGGLFGFNGVVDEAAAYTTLSVARFAAHAALR